MRSLARGLLALIVFAGAARAADVIVHFTDTHLPVAGSDATRAAAAAVLSSATGVVVTGDLTEFGGLESLARFDRVFAGLETWPTLGNHDATWRSLTATFWERYGRPFYGRDAGALRLLALDSTTCQDPRPHFAPEQLAWIRDEVARAGPGRPLLLAFHHPPWGSEFASPWARARLAEALSGAKVAAILAGHSHRSSTRRWAGHRVIVGGAAQGKDAGFTVVALSGETLEAGYHPNGASPRPLVREELRALAPLPAPRVRVVEGELVVSLSGHPGASVEVVRGPRAKLDEQGTARVPLAALDGGPTPGPRGVVVAEGDEGRLAAATVELPGGRARWSAHVGGGVRTRPIVLEGLLVVGTSAGELVALDPARGRLIWRVATKGPVLAAPLAWRGSIVFASGDGRVRAVSPDDGRERWTAALGAPLYAAPVTRGERLLATDLDGTLHELDGKGARLRSVRLADGPVEAPPLVAGGLLLQGAWDRRLHALDLEALAERWAVETDGPAGQKAKKYYSPADAPLARSGEVVFACDRDARLTALALEDGARRGGLADAWACAAEGPALFVKGAGSLRRHHARTLAEEWRTDLRLGRTPAPPLVLGDEVWTASDDGEVFALDARTGAVRHRERVTPGELLLAPLGGDDSNVYAGTLDGRVTALARGPD